MAIVPTTKNHISLLRNFKKEITGATTINTFDRDSKSRALIDVFSSEQINLRNQSVESFYANQLSNARGNALDAIGEKVNTPRQVATWAKSNEVSQNFAFYVETGTFSSINGGGGIVIPVGTAVYSRPNNNELGISIRYTLTESLVLDGAATVGYATVRAEGAGAQYNVGGATMRNHDFTSYLDFANDSLKVVNRFPVLNGRGTETDEQYRFRLSQYLVRVKQFNDTAIHLTAIDVPGVLDTRLIAGHFGIGTVGVVVLGPDSESTGDLVRGVQSRLSRLQGPGLSAIATAAIEVTLDLDLELKSTRNIAVQNRATIEQDIRRACYNYFRSSGIGGSIEFDVLAKTIQTETRGLIRLGAVGSEKKLFKNIYTRRGFSNAGSSERERVIKSTLLLSEDEYPELGILTTSWI